MNQCHQCLALFPGSGEEPGNEADQLQSYKYKHMVVCLGAFHLEAVTVDQMGVEETGVDEMRTWRCMTDMESWYTIRLLAVLLYFSSWAETTHNTSIIVMCLLLGYSVWYLLVFPAQGKLLATQQRQLQVYSVRGGWEGAVCVCVCVCEDTQM